MSLENKVLSKEISNILYEKELTVSTAESCTGGRVADAIIAIPGASNYFKGGIVCYTNEIKENLLHVEHALLEEKTAYCEEVAKAMVQGACKTMNTNLAIAVTGIAGPAGGTPELPVGTIWLACGTPDDIVTLKLTEDNGRDRNLARATSKALQLFLDYITERYPLVEEEAE